LQYEDTTDECRLFGVGIDQVVHMEVVLPNGVHVRFGPTAWEKKKGYPRVTQVSGYCNAAPSNDEAKWDWVACDDSLNINFADLWFAFRGGGGGSYGVLTSLHYQLHDYPGPLTIVAADATQLMPLVTGLNETVVYLLYRQYIEFIHLYLFVPSAIGVSELDSRGCNRYVCHVQSLTVAMVLRLMSH
jgi:FAD/FMN-containing dehydrogenase